MRRIDTFNIDTCTGDNDICAAVRITRWLIGVVWSNIAKSQTSEFMVVYDDQTITGTDIVSALQGKGYRCSIITAFPAPSLSRLHRSLIEQIRQFRVCQDYRCRTQLLPSPGCCI